MVWLIAINQCCHVINFYTYPMDTNKDWKKNWTKKDMYSKKKLILYNRWLHIYFLKGSFVGYVYVGVQLSKHGGYAYQISKYIA